MAKLFHPVHLIGVPFLLLASIPLATFALFTTSIAISTLLIRVSIVYLELGIALVHSWIFVESPGSAIGRIYTNPPTPERTSPPRRRRRQSSAASSQSPQEIISRHRSRSSASLMFASAPGRDFEGIGGWRTFGNGQEEALWLKINSRLELPSTVVEKPRKHHQRRWTGGSPEFLRISPVQSRARTPSVSEGPSSPVEYFSMPPHGRVHIVGDNPAPKEEARKSLSASSMSSSSSRSSRTTIKHVGPG